MCEGRIIWHREPRPPRDPPGEPRNKRESSGDSGGESGAEPGERGGLGADAAGAAGSCRSGAVILGSGCVPVGTHDLPCQALTMSEDSCRTRSQKRALERESEPDNKKLRMDKGILGSELNSEGDMKIKADPGAGKIPGMLKSGEVKATIKVELPAGDEPVDMSTSKGEVRRERRVPSPDVIVLSDTEPSSPRLNGLSGPGPGPTQPPGQPRADALLRSSPEERERLIKQLKEELRLEEAKLVLLKKLRQSQIQKETPAPKTSSSRIPGTVIPPPLVRGGQAASSKLGTQPSPQIVMPPLVRGAQQIHTIRQHSSTGPLPCCWPRAPPCPACRSRASGSSSRASSAWPTCPTPACSSTSRRHPPRP